MIYAIQVVGTDYVKFGITEQRRINDRVSCLQVGCPFELELIAWAEWHNSDEQRIHRYMHDQHVRGEWFKLGDKAKLVIDAMLRDDRSAFIDAFFAKSKHSRLGAAIDLCRDIAEQHQPPVRSAPSQPST